MLMKPFAEFIGTFIFVTVIPGATDPGSVSEFAGGALADLLHPQARPARTDPHLKGGQGRRSHAALSHDSADQRCLAAIHLVIVPLEPEERDPEDDLA